MEEENAFPNRVPESESLELIAKIYDGTAEDPAVDGSTIIRLRYWVDWLLKYGAAIDELNKLFQVRLSECYHRKIHSTLGITPEADEDRQKRIP